MVHMNTKNYLNGKTYLEQFFTSSFYDLTNVLTPIETAYFKAFPLV